MEEKLQKLEQQKRKREEDLKLKELEKYEIKFKRKSSAKVKKIDETQKNFIDNLIINPSTKNNNKINDSISQKANSKNKFKTNTNNINNTGNNTNGTFNGTTNIEGYKVENIKHNINPLNPPNESKKSFKNEKIELDCDTSLYKNTENEDLFISSINLKDYKNLIKEYGEVFNFLEELNLHNNYFKVFIQNEFMDMQSILLIEDKHLEEMNINGNSKNKIMNKIREIKGVSIEEGSKYDKLPENTNKNNNKNSILNEDNYDEAEQKRLFQQAVMDFRNGNTNENTNVIVKVKENVNDKAKILIKNKQHQQESGIATDLIGHSTTTNDIYDESEQRRLFQEAVMEFRNSSTRNTEKKDSGYRNGLSEENDINVKVKTINTMSNVDSMSIPIGNKTYCWSCYKVIIMESSISDKVVPGKQFCSYNCLNKYKVKCSGFNCEISFDKCNGNLLGDKWYCSEECYKYALSKDEKVNEESNTYTYTKEAKSNTINIIEDNSEEKSDDKEDDYDPMSDF